MNQPGRVVMLEGLASTITDDELEYLIERIGAYRFARVVPYLKDTRRIESDPASEASRSRNTFAEGVTDDELTYLIEKVGAGRMALLVEGVTRRDPRIREVRVIRDLDDDSSDPIRNTWAEPPMGQG